MRLRAAAEPDLGTLFELIGVYARRGLLLPRSQASLRARLGEFVVAVRETPWGEQVVGCGALTRLAPGLGELRSLAVRADATGRGVGWAIAGHLLGHARRRGLLEVLALTRRPGFFEALGFLPTRRERFPAKLRADCSGCPFDAGCGEVALVARLPAASAQRGEPHEPGVGGYRGAGQDRAGAGEGRPGLGGAVEHPIAAA